MLSYVKTEQLRFGADINNGCAVAVGSFDGVHIGHRALISQLVSEAENHNVPAAVFTFASEDSPKPDSKLLAQPSIKPRLLAEAGVDILVSAPFSVFREMSASDFVSRLLVDFMGARSVVCGYDFRFGSGREGDVELMRSILVPKGVSVLSFSAFEESGVPVSSTLIRTLISDGEIKKANSLLGRRFSFKAPVCGGAKLGRTLGFPTANQKYPAGLVLPKLGVYAVECVIGGNRFGGVANVGVKPTVGGIAEPLCETHIFGFHGDCYGKEIETEFVDFIREERRFSSLDALKEQIGMDRKKACDILSEGVCL